MDWYRIRRLGFHDLLSNERGDLMLKCSSQHNSGKVPLNREDFLAFQGLSTPPGAKRFIGLVNAYDEKAAFESRFVVDVCWVGEGRKAYQLLRPRDFSINPQHAGHPLP